MNLIPWALDVVWRFYATHQSGLQATALPVRGLDRTAAVALEIRAAEAGADA